MAKNDTYFYADIDDLECFLRDLGVEQQLKYVLQKSAVGVALEPVDDPGVLLNILGESRIEVPSIRALVMGLNVNINSRRVIMADGSGDIYVADNATNPTAVELNIGRTFARDRTLLCSRCCTLGETSASTSTFKVINKMILSRSVAVADARVFPGALEKLKSGWRLTRGIGYGPAMDLKCE